MTLETMAVAVVLVCLKAAAVGLLVVLGVCIFWAMCCRLRQPRPTAKASCCCKKPLMTQSAVIKARLCHCGADEGAE